MHSAAPVAARLRCCRWARPAVPGRTLANRRWGTCSEQGCQQTGRETVYPVAGSPGKDCSINSAYSSRTECTAPGTLYSTSPPFTSPPPCALQGAQPPIVTIPGLTKDAAIAARDLAGAIYEDQGLCTSCPLQAALVCNCGACCRRRCEGRCRHDRSIDEQPSPVLASILVTSKRTHKHCERAKLSRSAERL